MEVEGLKRCEEENPLGLTNMQLEQRKEAIEKQMEKHPNVSPQWIEWLWNFLSRHSEEECAEMVNTGKLKCCGEDKDAEKCPTPPLKSAEDTSS